MRGKAVWLPKQGKASKGEGGPTVKNSLEERRRLHFLNCHHKESTRKGLTKKARYKASRLGLSYLDLEHFGRIRNRKVERGVYVLSGGIEANRRSLIDNFLRGERVKQERVPGASTSPLPRETGGGLFEGAGN